MDFNCEVCFWNEWADGNPNYVMCKDCPHKKEKKVDDK
jgi:hypothetical protein